MVQATSREYTIRDIDLIWRMKGRVGKTSEEMLELLCEGEAEEVKKKNGREDGRIDYYQRKYLP